MTIVTELFFRSSKPSYACQCLRSPGLPSAPSSPFLPGGPGGPVCPRGPSRPETSHITSAGAAHGDLCSAQQESRSTE
jgi:hypothetical protein